MKGKFLKILAALACLALTVGFAACGGDLDSGSEENSSVADSESLSEGELSEDILATVTYYANGGEFRNGLTVQRLYHGRDAVTYKTVGMDGSEYFGAITIERHQGNSRYPINIGFDTIVTGSTAYVTLERENYEFNGWYHIVVDEETGEPIADAETGECALDMERPVDFEALLENGEQWHIGAYWEEKVKVCVRLVCDSIITDKDGVTYDPAADADIKVSYYISRPPYATDLRVDKSPIGLSDDSEYQFAGYYFDKEGKQPITAELVKEDGQTEDKIVYAKYISKDWTVVRTVNDVRNMFGYLQDSEKKFYIARDIDMSGVTGTPWYNNLAATVEGNGFTISNLKFTASSISSKHAMFKTVKASANVKNLNLDVAFDCRLKAMSELYFVFAGYEDGATIENVTVSGTMTIIGGNTVNNMLNGYANCLFGGFTSDEEYTAAYPNGFKVLGNPEEFITIE